MKKLRLFSSLIIMSSLIIVLFNFVITGNVIGPSSPLSLLAVFLFVSGIVLLLVSLERRVKIRNTVYDSHALSQMRQRNIFPAVVEDALESGEHYKLVHIGDYEQTRGATQAYIRRNTASQLKRHNGIPEIIRIPRQGKRNYRHVIVLTDNEGIVKTAYTADNHDLRLFLKNYTKEEQEALVAQ